jgi:hypothetical protein
VLAFAPPPTFGQSRPGNAGGFEFYIQNSRRCGGTRNGWQREMGKFLAVNANKDPATGGVGRRCGAPGVPPIARRCRSRKSQGLLGGAHR